MPNWNRNPPHDPETRYISYMNETAFLLIPSSSKLAGLGHLWLEYASREAAEDAQDEFADRGLNYDLVPVLG